MDAKTKKTPTRLFNFRLPVDIDAWLSDRSASDHVSKSDIIRGLLLKAMRAEKAGA